MRDATRTEALERDRAMWRTYARTGHLLNILVLLIDTAYVVATWTTGAHRPLLLALDLGALIGLAVAYTVVPETKVAASPRRDLIFGIWMFSGVCLVTAAAWLDGGIHSPLAWLLPISVMFTAVAHRPRMVWISNWAIGARGEEARRLGYLAPGSDRAIDFTNPDAAAWFRDGLRAFLEGPEGRYVDGLFLDRSDEPDVPSEASDVYADGRTGAEVHNAYPVLFQQNVRQVLDEVRPDATFAIARAAYTGTAGLVMTWGGDTHSRDGFQVPETPASGPSTTSPPSSFCRRRT